MKSVALVSKQTNKDRRQREVLFALVDYFIKTAKPVGSTTLKEIGFPELSSATIRNYFSHLESEGYLRQQHTSAGRVPTDRAYRLYVEDLLKQKETPSLYRVSPEKLPHEETREIAHYLQRAAELLSEVTQTAVFFSAPRFDHDFVVSVKLVRISPQRLVCLLITEFGEIQTIVLNSDLRLSSFAVKRIEAYCQWRLNGLQKPEPLEPEEEALAQTFYNEAMLRYIVRYSHFIDEEIYRTGFSKLLLYPEFRDPQLLAHSLSLFENGHSMRLLLRECSSTSQLKYWIGEDLLTYSQQPPNCSVVAMPYNVNFTCVGAMGLLGPMRMPYRELFATLRAFSEEVSDVLTRSIYKFKIKYRQPEQHTLYLPKNQLFGVDTAQKMLPFDKK
jgi:heat-inducible transcriptional repressor